MAQCSHEANSITRFSSRREPLDSAYLNTALTGAKHYDRIAGYFSSSILEVAGESIEAVQNTVRVICNSGLHPKDVETAKIAKQNQRLEWNGSDVIDRAEHGPERFQRLYHLLRSGKLEVRVLADQHFGLMHGKAGVITRADGGQTCFLGSVNESKNGWRINYELLWTDDSKAAVAWVQEEFEALWQHPFACPLADAVVADVGRLSRRRVQGLPEWRKASGPASVAVEAPVTRQSVGLWAHQKYFVKHAFDAHKTQRGARFVLADEVGLGKTLQLGMAAELMALNSERPVLVLAPKPLLWQWQGELKSLLDVPSAVWTGEGWRDENEILYPSTSAEDVCACPRRIGIVSTGLITYDGVVADELRHRRWSCVVLDEAHRARRKNLVRGQEYQNAQPNKLLAFLREISRKTHSLLLGTATPVQIHPIEAWDLLDVLSRASDAVLGGPGSHWRRPKNAIETLLGTRDLPDDPRAMWDWLRNPLPPAEEGPLYQIIRQKLKLNRKDFVIAAERFDELRAPERARIKNGFDDFIGNANPFIRRIVLRRRRYLENTLDPETGEPYLQRVSVRLHGDADDQAIAMPPFFRDAYELAEAFCALLARRSKAAGYFRTLLLRRFGSTIEAGRQTVVKLLSDWQDLDEDQAEEDETSKLGTLSGEERQTLERLLSTLESNQSPDPKLAVLRELLIDRGWLEPGCIVFTQYFASAEWLLGQMFDLLPRETMGLYAGSGRSQIAVNGERRYCDREEIKRRVTDGDIRLLIGTDAAAEGLNLQRLGTLVNLDLPWNPSRLEQRKGRIQRIGQILDTVDIYNMRYRDSVEDRVHHLLSSRLEAITSLFGQLPDFLEDVWIEVALGNQERALQTIDAVPDQHPFELRYREHVEPIDWEFCAEVLDQIAAREWLKTPWR